jgi:hypothetical protein
MELSACKPMSGLLGGEDGLVWVAYRPSKAEFDATEAARNGNWVWSRSAVQLEGSKQKGSKLK